MSTIDYSNCVEIFTSKLYVIRVLFKTKQKERVFLLDKIERLRTNQTLFSTWVTLKKHFLSLLKCVDIPGFVYTLIYYS